MPTLFDAYADIFRIATFQPHIPPHHAEPRVPQRLPFEAPDRQRPNGRAARPPFA
jgi:hypothetical protein